MPFVQYKNVIRFKEEWRRDSRAIATSSSPAVWYLVAWPEIACFVCGCAIYLACIRVALEKCFAFGPGKRIVSRKEFPVPADFT